MSDLISREALLEALKDNGTVYKDDFKNNEFVYFSDVLDLITNAPAIEQEPVLQQQVTSNDVKAALLFCLWHHQGAHSKIGQPIRHALGIANDAQLTDDQMDIARCVQSALQNWDGTKEEPSQKKNEPVAWYWDNNHRDKIPYVGIERGSPKMDVIFGTPIPLYAVIPQKQWVGLSDAEKKYYATTNHTTVWNLIDEVETKLKD